MYRIGELAKHFDINQDTLRFYEKNQLLVPSERSGAGYRLYTEQDKQTLSFILRAKAVGFSLKEIQELLSIEIDKANNACADVKTLVDHKRLAVEEKIAELQAFQLSLQRLSDACCGGNVSAVHCTILEALETGETKVRSENHSHEFKEQQDVVAE